LNQESLDHKQAGKTGTLSAVLAHRGVILLAEDNMSNILAIREYVEMQKVKCLQSSRIAFLYGFGA